MQEQKGFYEFGPFRIDTAKRLLIRDQASIPIAPKVFETLLTLVRNPGRVLEKDELLKAIWSDSFVEEASLANSVSALRKILGEHPKEHVFIVTVPGRGYRFVADVRVHAAENAEAGVEQQGNEARIESRKETRTSVVTSVAVSSGISKRFKLFAALASTLLLAAVAGWWLNWSTPHPPGLSIAVLPFQSINGDTETGHFSDGLTAQLVHALAVEPGFNVNTAEVKLKGKDPDLQTLARQTHVAVVLKGSVQRSGTQTRVTAQLISLPNGQNFWSETYELGGDHVLDSQASIASIIVRTLRSRFGGFSSQQMNEPATRSATALKWYLEAREGWLTQRRPGLLKSVEDYRKAISEDPAYADAYAGLAASELFLASIDKTSGNGLANAKTALSRALALNDRLADAHALMGNIYMRREWEFAAAERELKRALELQPGTSPYEYWYALAASLSGHMGEALAELEIGRMINPKSETIRMATGTVYLVMRQFDATERCARQALDLKASDSLSRELLGLALEQQGRYSEAIAEFRGCSATSRESALCLPDLGHALALTGNAAEARAIQQKLDSKPHPDGMARALLWLGLKNNGRALDMLEKAYSEHELKLPWVRVDPRFDPLLSESRFAALLDRIGLPL